MSRDPGLTHSPYRLAARAALAEAWATISPAERTSLSRRRLFRELAKTYPFDPRLSWPYKCWLRECHLLIGKPPRRWPKNAPPLPFEE